MSRDFCHVTTNFFKPVSSYSDRKHLIPNDCHSRVVDVTRSGRPELLYSASSPATRDTPYMRTTVRRACPRIRARTRYRRGRCDCCGAWPDHLRDIGGRKWNYTERAPTATTFICYLILGSPRRYNNTITRRCYYWLLLLSRAVAWRRGWGRRRRRRKRRRRKRRTPNT